jgi:hypothetical protein
VGQKVFFNFNCVVLDVMPVEIGSNVLFGPSVQVYTATHPIAAAERRLWLESARPVKIGSDVWIGGGAQPAPGKLLQQSLPPLPRHPHPATPILFEHFILRCGRCHSHLPSDIYDPLR